MSAIVKLILEDGVHSKANMADYKNEKTIPAILTWECECYDERDFDVYCEMQMRFS